jgi:hypothetical protein
MYKYKLKERAFNQPQDVKKYQEERIAAFKAIEARLNSLYPAIDRAKDETIAYYNENPRIIYCSYPYRFDYGLFKRY